MAGENVGQPTDTSRLDDKIARLDTEIKRLDQLRTADQLAVAAALASQEKAVAAALAASDKGVDKAEGAQKVVNASQNEFRQTLRDQALLFMPRTETDNLFRELRGVLDEANRQINELRRAQANLAGRITTIGAVFGVIVVVVSFSIQLLLR